MFVGWLQHRHLLDMFTIGVRFVQWTVTWLCRMVQEVEFVSLFALAWLLLPSLKVYQ